MSLISEIIGFFIKRRLPRIEEFKEFPIEVQNDVFFSLIERAKYTDFGLKYKFSSIHSIKDFQEQVPIQSYEDLYPSIERVLKGENNVLWPTDIHWFSKSSGTTNARSKYIPVSEESLEECHYRGGKDLLTFYFQNKEKSMLFDGKGLSIGGSLHANPFNSESMIGDISAVMTQNLPKWADYFRVPPVEIALLEKWEDKMKLMVEVCSKENVTGIWGVPTWTVVLIESILKHTGAKNILEIWPNFEVFFHGAVAFGPYRNLFENVLLPNPNINYLESYNASEGFFAIQDDFALKDQLLLMLDYGMFYEFIPMHEWDKERPQTLTLADVELNKNYALVISTTGGLWRYKIGDTVKFTSLHPFRIKVSGRVKQFINAFGEELIVENADLALEKASRECEVSLVDYTAGPIFMEEGNQAGHEWIIECSTIPENVDKFIRVLDDKLKEINSDYDAKRHLNMALSLPKVHFVEKGSFYTWMSKRGKVGGQHKVPRLANDREFLEDFFKSHNK